MNEMTRTLEEVKESVRTENWRQRIQECQQSGKSVQVWCKENGIAASTYYKYLRKIRETLLQDNQIVALELPKTEKPADIRIECGTITVTLERTIFCVQTYYTTPSMRQHYIFLL
jgi:transposase-like protein